MLSPSTAVLGLLAASAPALSLVHHLGDEVESGLAALSRRDAAPVFGREVVDDEAFEPIEIDVYVHVVESSQDGKISNEAISAQMDIVNDAFKVANVSFVIKDMETRVDAEWAAKDMDDMRWKTHKGSGRDLNLWILEKIDAASMKSGSRTRSMTDSPRDETAYMIDGVALAAFAIPNAPGWTEDGDFEGKAAIKAFAAWMGVPPVFVRYCDPSDYLLGPLVDDVPIGRAYHVFEKAQQPKVTECSTPTPRDTCPEEMNDKMFGGKNPLLRGPDPLDNYMSIHLEACRNRFSPGQMRSMHRNWKHIRADHKTFGPDKEWVPEIKVVHREDGKLPYYEDPWTEAAQHFCSPDRHGHVEIEQESRCGTYNYCNALLGHEARTLEDFQKTRRCRRERARNPNSAWDDYKEDGLYGK